MSIPSPPNPEPHYSRGSEPSLPSGRFAPRQQPQGAFIPPKRSLGVRSVVVTLALLLVVLGVGWLVLFGG